MKLKGNSERAFRFGVYMTAPGSRRDMARKCRQAEAMGYDVIGMPDHIGLVAPFPSLMLAAQVTERPRLATAVLNAAFYNPTLLARDVAAIDQLTDGRLELGLGTGYMKVEFDTAGLPWPEPRVRLEHLGHTVSELRRLFSDPDYRPHPVQQPCPPLWLGGRGDRVLAMAAREANIVGFTGFTRDSDGAMPFLADIDGVSERVDYVNGLLGDRVGQVEFNVHVWGVFVTNDRYSEAKRLDPLRGLTADQMLQVPTVLIGSVRQIAEQLVEFRQRLGFTYIMVPEHYFEDFAPVIEHLR